MISRFRRTYRRRMHRNDFDETSETFSHDEHGFEAQLFFDWSLDTSEVFSSNHNNMDLSSDYEKQLKEATRESKKEAKRYEKQQKYIEKQERKIIRYAKSMSKLNSNTTRWCIFSRGSMDMESQSYENSIDLKKRFDEEESCTSKVKDCPICLEELEHPSSVLSLPCGHVFHEICVKKWLLTKSTCPVCNFDIKA